MTIDMKFYIYQKFPAVWYRYQRAQQCSVFKNVHKSTCKHTLEYVGVKKHTFIKVLFCLLFFFPFFLPSVQPTKSKRALVANGRYKHQQTKVIFSTIIIRLCQCTTVFMMVYSRSLQAVARQSNINYLHYLIIKWHKFLYTRSVTFPSGNHTPGSKSYSNLVDAWVDTVNGHKPVNK